VAPKIAFERQIEDFCHPARKTKRALYWMIKRLLSDTAGDKKIRLSAKMNF
jgi:hypothetical protein